MKIIVSEKNNGKNINLNDLVTDMLSQELFGEVPREESEIEGLLVATNPMIRKNREVSFVSWGNDRNQFVGNEVLNKHISIQYNDGWETLNLERLVGYFRRATTLLDAQSQASERYGRDSILVGFLRVFTNSSGGARTVSDLVVNNQNQASQQRSNPSQLFLRYVQNKLRANPNPLVNIDGGMHVGFSRTIGNIQFFNSTNIKQAHRNRKQVIEGASNLFLNNVYENSDICWGNFSENLSAIVRTFKSQSSTTGDSTCTPAAIGIANAFLGSSFNRDLEAEKRTNTYAKKLVQAMINCDYTKGRLSQGESNELRQFIMQHASEFENAFRNSDSFHSKHYFFFSTIFDLNFSDFN